jgi:WD40 repeat protein
MKRALWSLMLALLTTTNAPAANGPASFRRDVQPLLRANCVACHKPSRDKGGLDVTSHAALLRGGKHGTVLIPGDPAKSRLIRDVSGPGPAMPEEGEPLLPEEIDLLSRWIAEGAVDDTQAPRTTALEPPPVYRRLPPVSALAWSPDATFLAVAAHNEVLFYADGSETPSHRLRGEATRIESIAFSSSGRLLAAAGGAPSEFGEIQIWESRQGVLLRAIRTTSEVVHGVSFSADERLVAVGCADKLVRIFAVDSGEERMRCDNHIDWVLATAFTGDGKRVVSASRDRALKLIDVASGRLIDDVAVPRGPLTCLARHPSEDLVAYGSSDGQVFLNRMEPRGGRLSENDNKELSLVRSFPRSNGAVCALAFSSDGTLLASVSARGEASVFNAADGKKTASLKSPAQPLFAVAFHPHRGEVAAAGFDGTIRVYDARDGKQLTQWDAVPLAPENP